MARTDFTTPRLCVDDALARGRTLALAPRRRTISSTCCGSKPGARVLVLQWPRRRIGGARSSGERKRAALRVEEKRGHRNCRPTSTICSRRSSTPGSTIWRRRRSRWARGGSPRAHPPHQGRARQPRAAGGQCARGLRAMRRHLAPRNRSRRSRSSAALGAMAGRSGCSCSATRMRRSPIRSTRSPRARRRWRQPADRPRRRIRRRGTRR